ncbi:MAG: class I SAM-dependent methyltransferase [bacterium]
MHKATVNKLNQLNRDFYQKTAEIFSQTRNYSWAGWDKLIEIIKTENLEIQSVLDLGCGNGRFYQFISKYFPKVSYTGVDQDEKLLAIAGERNSNLVLKQVQDRISEKGQPSYSLRTPDTDHRSPIFTHNNLLVHNKQIFSQTYDLIAIFGLMHHIPGLQKRKQLIDRAFKALTPSGVLVVSFWDFLQEEKYQKRLIDWSLADIKPENLEKNDYLLDWQKGEKAYRYCHYADSAEIEQLFSGLPAKFTRNFSADGKSGKLNRYVVIG